MCEEVFSGFHERACNSVHERTCSSVCVVGRVCSSVCVVVYVQGSVPCRRGRWRPLALAGMRRPPRRIETTATGGTGQGRAG